MSSRKFCHRVSCLFHFYHDLDLGASWSEIPAAFVVLTYDSLSRDSLSFFGKGRIRIMIFENGSRIRKRRVKRFYISKKEVRGFFALSSDIFGRGNVLRLDENWKKWIMKMKRRFRLLSFIVASK